MAGAEIAGKGCRDIEVGRGDGGVQGLSRDGPCSGSKFWIHLVVRAHRKN